jgi:serine/threonine-protein kinase
MAITNPFVLPAGVTFQAAGDLSEQARRDIGAQDGDVVLSRPNSRARAQVVDAAAVELLMEFQEPSTIAFAVAAFSKRTGVDAERTLEDALPMLQSLISAGLLVLSNSEQAAQIQPSLAADEKVGSWTVLRCVQTMEDTEIYQAWDSDAKFGALKIGRWETAAGAIEREAQILSQLDSTVTPRLLGRGVWESRPYLIMNWLPGTEAQTACGELRVAGTWESRNELLQITGVIAQAYVHLHKQGMLHGDIHPRNVLIDRENAAKIVDLGLAYPIAGTSDTYWKTRGGIGFFFEPEYARAALNNAVPPPPSPQGEQYSLAALLYFLITGSYYVKFSLGRREMLGQIAESPMVPFAEFGIEPWPGVEHLLERALSKEPADRFSSVEQFARLWSEAEVPRPLAGAAPSSESKLDAVRDGVLEASAIGSALMNGGMVAPSASVNYGSAGLAMALYRVADASEDARLLATADIWSERAVTEIDCDGAFYDEIIGITPQLVGSLSLYHGPAGIFLVKALIARSRGDLMSYYAATQAFIAVCRQPCEVLDLTLGCAGALLGCALLLETFAGSNDELRRVGEEMYGRLWERLAGNSPIDRSSGSIGLAVAHGWAGLLYASMCWCVVAAKPIADQLHSRIAELARCSQPVGRGLRWASRTSTARNDDSMSATWCNGSAGFVFVWTKAHRMTGDPKYLDLAEGAAWHCWERLSQNSTLCCGSGGQAYAMLNLYRHCGDSSWLRRARNAANVAARNALRFSGSQGAGMLDWRSHSLYKGNAGLAVLQADVASPEEARMPLFEPDA